MSLINNLLILIIKINRNKCLTVLKTIVILSFISAGKPYAQDLNLFGVEYFNYPKSSLKDAINDEEMSAHEFIAFANIPTRINEDKTIMINGLRYGFVESTSYNSPLFESTENKKKLHVISYSFMLIHKLNKEWTLMANIKPTLSSDFEEKLNGEDFLIQGAALASKKFSDNFTLGGGLIFTSQYGVPSLLPSLQVNYKSGKHAISAFLPSKINYFYHLEEEKLRVGLRAAVNGSYFNVAGNEFDNVSVNKIDKVIYSRINVGPVINYKFTDIIQLDLFAGYSTARKFQLADFDENEFKLDLENGPFLNIGLIFTPPKK